MSTSPLSRSSTRNDAFTAAQERSEAARATADAARSTRGDVFSEHLRKKATTPRGERSPGEARERAEDAAGLRGGEGRGSVPAPRAQNGSRADAGPAKSSGRLAEAPTSESAGAAERDGPAGGPEGADAAAAKSSDGTAGASGHAGAGSGELEDQIAAAAAQPLSVRNLNQLLATIDPKLVAEGVVKNPAGGAPLGAGAVAEGADESAESPGSSASAADGSSGAGRPARERQEPTAPSDDGSAGTVGENAGTTEKVAGAQATPDSATIGDARSEIVHASKGNPVDVAPAGRSAEPATPSTVSPSLPGATPTSSVADKPGVLAGADAATVWRAQHADLNGADTASVAGQVSRGLAAALKQQGGQVTLRLRPEALGHVRIELNLQPGLVDVRFVAGTAQAQALLKGSLDTLKDSLERQGLTVGRVQVDGDDIDVLSSISHARKHAGSDGSEVSPGYSEAPDAPSGPAGRGEYADQTATPEREAAGQGGGHGERNPQFAHDGAERRDVQSSAARSDANLDDLSLGAAAATRNGVLDVVTLRLDAVA